MTANLLALLGAMIYFAPVIYLRHTLLQGWADEAGGKLDDEENAPSAQKELVLKAALALWIAIPPAVLLYLSS